MSQNETHQHTTNPWFFALYLGFFAGLLWGFVKLAIYYLEFTKVAPIFMIKSWFRDDFAKSWPGQFVGWGSFILLSIIASYIYILLFRKIKGPWLGMLYGAVWWSALYIFIGPPNGMMPTIYKLDSNSFWSDLCLFLLWGVFIGYSIAFEFTNDQELKSSTDALK